MIAPLVVGTVLWGSLIGFFLTPLRHGARFLRWELRSTSPVEEARARRQREARELLK